MSLVMARYFWRTERGMLLRRRLRHFIHNLFVVDWTSGDPPQHSAFGLIVALFGIAIGAIIVWALASGVFLLD